MLTKRQIDEIRNISWESVAKALQPLSSDELIDLIDNKYVKITDTACSLLSARGEKALIADGLIAGKIHTRRGKMGAIFTLYLSGWRSPKIGSVSEFMLSDRSHDVVTEALFGAVFLGRREAIPLIEKRLQIVKNPKTKAAFELALKAFAEDDPYIYSPGYGRQNIFRWRKNPSKKLRDAAKAEEDELNS